MHVDIQNTRIVHACDRHKNNSVYMHISTHTNTKQKDNNSKTLSRKKYYSNLAFNCGKEMHFDTQPVQKTLMLEVVMAESGLE